MTSLTDFLDDEALRQLQETFGAAAGVAIDVCDRSGRPILTELPPADKADELDSADDDSFPLCEAPIVIGDDIVGCVRMPPHEQDSSDESNRRAGGLLRLLADVVGRLCEQRRLVKSRVGELATLYRLTAEFSGQEDLQSLLDLVAATVVQVLKAKGCTIRLLSEDRRELTVKAVANLSPEYLNKGPILLSGSEIDREVLDSLKPVYIADQQSDPRVMYPREARREGIVSALCVPLVYKGRPEGVLRVYMAQVHEFDWFETSLVQAIAGNAAAAIVNARLDQEALVGANIRRHLRTAAVVQRRMIPERPPVTEGFDIGAIYVPCFELGGDFYDFIELPEDNVGLAVCDVVGKGVRASLLMAAVRASLRAHASNVYDMSDVLGRVNRTFCSDSQDGDFATMFYAVLNLRSRLLTYANAGHMPPLLFRDSTISRLTTGGGVLGINELAHWGHDSVICRTGDVILAYTDGLNEALNFDDEAFGTERIEQAAQAAISKGRDADGIVKHVLWEMRRFAGLQTRLDDLTIVAIRTL